MPSWLNTYKPYSVEVFERVDLKDEKYVYNETSLSAVKNGAECIWRKQMMNQWLRLRDGRDKAWQFCQLALGGKQLGYDE